MVVWTRAVEKEGRHQNDDKASNEGVSREGYSRVAVAEGTFLIRTSQVKETPCPNVQK